MHAHAMHHPSMGRGPGSTAGRRFPLAPLALMAMAAGRGHRGRGPHGFGPGPRGGFPFGRGFGFGHGPMFGRGPRAGRGDVRAAILVLLAEEPCNGYQLIQEIAQRSGGVWRPSPGSVYPALQQLQDEGLVRADESSGKRTFELTDAGRTYVAEHEDELAAPWDAVAGNVDEGMVEMSKLIGQLGIAAMQVTQAGSAEQLAEARKVLSDARRALYRILAEDEPEGDEA